MNRYRRTPRSAQQQSPRGLWHPLLVGVWFLVASEQWLAAGQVLPPIGQALPVLSSAEQVRQLSEEDTKKGYPVRLRAVVTYSDREGFLCFVQDSTAGIFVVPEEFPNVHEGQLVEVVGVAAPGAYAPEVDHARVSVVGA